MNNLTILDLKGNNFDSPEIQTYLDKSLTSLMEFLAESRDKDVVK